MNRRKFIKTAGVCLAAISVGQLFGATDAKKPNIIIINVDDLGWTDLACFGSKYYETPNIDALCARGMKFTQAYAACAVCSPTRAAIMTGRYPARIGVTDWIHFLDFKGDKTNLNQKGPTAYIGGKNKPLLCPPNPFWMDLSEVTIAEVLKDNGYSTCHIGKWHLGPDAWYPDKQGFDTNIGGCDHGQPPSYFDPYHRNAERPNIPTLKPRKEGEYLTDREADEAVGFITQHKDKPFFLHMAHYAVHTPIQGKKDLVSKYTNKAKSNQKNAKYAAMIESVDNAVGKIVKTLDQIKLTKRTIIIFTSDNGGLSHVTSNLPLRAGKGHPYEGGIRIPQIICWPGMVKPGTVCSTPVISVDLFPTIAAAAGAKLPNRIIDGKSLMPLLRQSAPLKRDAIFWHFPHYRGEMAPYSIIRQGKWKLIKRYHGRTPELFNLENDLPEKQDLASQMPEKVAKLESRLMELLKHANAKLPKINPDYKQ
jgi:arylsulfatase A